MYIFNVRLYAQIITKRRIYLLELFVYKISHKGIFL